MTAEADKHLDGTGFSGRRVRQAAVPSTARTDSTLAHVDYEDAFVVETGSARERTGEEWARAMLEGAPLATRRALRRGWWTLGLRLGSTGSDRLVLGWEVRRSDADRALLGAPGRLGISGELLLEPGQDTLLFATLVQLDNPVARLVWRGIAPYHRHVVQHILGRLSRSDP